MTLGDEKPTGREIAVESVRSGEIHIQHLAFTIFEISEFQAVKSFFQIDESNPALRGM